jgi:hypothetical protein
MSDHSPSPVPAWQGFALDVLIVVSLTVLTALRIAQLTIFLAVVGPIVGARLSAMRHGSGGNGSGTGNGSAVLALAFGLWSLVRRPA